MKDLDLEQLKNEQTRYVLDSTPGEYKTRLNSPRRLGLGDTVMDSIRKLSGGNGGSSAALMSIAGDYPRIDPRCAMAEINAYLAFDELGIHDDLIYAFWSDCCDKDDVAAITLFRACQLGIIKATEIFNGLHPERSCGSSLLQLAAKAFPKVQERLPDFNGGKSWPQEVPIP